MINRIRLKLIELARQRTTWSYSQLNDQLELGLKFTNNGPDNKLIGDWLGEISRHEFEKGRPLLSSLITHKQIPREQGPGFYTLCSELLEKDVEELKNDKKWENQTIANCFEFWLNANNYSKYKNDF
jgi:hypothetical protein